MPRKPDLIPKTSLNLRLPVPLRAKLDLLLHSDLEERVPLGRYSAFICARLEEHFTWTTLDLHPFGFPAGSFVRGPKICVDRLREKLYTLDKEPQP